ncbi:MAG: hypothetical protein GY895_07915 [Phycisphaera sp.]|nr:hypothetical protein [Phycisphaera sp.]
MMTPDRLRCVLPNRRISGSILAILTCTSTGLSNTPAAGDDGDRREVRLTEEIRDLVERPADRELDPRIDAARITTLPSGEAPETVLLPKAPMHRIAGDRNQTDLATETWQTAMESLQRGLEWMVANQSSRGAWMEGERVEATDQPPREAAAAIAVTAMGLKAFAQAGSTSPAHQAARDQALMFVRSELENRGFEGIDSTGLGNYVTSAVTMGLAALGSDSDPGNVMLLSRAVDHLTGGQWDQAEGVGPDRDWFGGAGYGRHGRPDLSNTQMMLDALYDAGVSPDEPAVQRALVFLGRSQNLKATNPAAWAQAGSNDGGFIYTPANGGESFGSQTAGEGRYGETMPAGVARSLRSYGSMTYAGFKSLLFAGLDADDPRVAAALDWIRGHWTFEENPGLGQQGLYYYLHAMARALRASGIDVITTPDGVAHDWRTEMISVLAAKQEAGGSWRNDVDRWEESKRPLATAYAVLAIEEALKPTREIE